MMINDVESKYEFKINTKQAEEIVRKSADACGITLKEFMETQKEFEEFKNNQKKVERLNKAVGRVQENKNLYKNYYIEFHKDDFEEQNLDIPTIRMGFNAGFDEAVYRILMEYGRLNDADCYK